MTYDTYCYHHDTCTITHAPPSCVCVLRACVQSTTRLIGVRLDRGQRVYTRTRQTHCRTVSRRPAGPSVSIHKSSSGVVVRASVSIHKSSRGVVARAVRFHSCESSRGSRPFPFIKARGGGVRAVASPRGGRVSPRTAGETPRRVRPTARLRFPPARRRRGARRIDFRPGVLPSSYGFYLFFIYFCVFVSATRKVRRGATGRP